ncbi:type II toxin-antitoxin system PemK/MazF family toxin [Enterococcus faecalis]|uniref:type II toxin-antitoxin system PemK/MazF family toxin n=1 Tax=Enterococcus faecalis TaxID=1351 RepID=UPI002DBC39DB|nr:type II toxin-antitoxin system PemK/MazF family toxin [Enterococcus faecalis]MEB7428251.1 type II toxin-antitoxin system PemK/MazF family toxin [Enterococcus faecalis]
MVKVPHQGDILLLNTAPRSGHEQTGKRPYIVLSHDIIADYSNVVIVAPISSTKRNYPLYVSINPSYEMKTSGKVLLDQLTTIDYEARQCVFLETAHEKLIDELLLKVRTVFQKVNKTDRF